MTSTNKENLNEYLSTEEIAHIKRIEHVVNLQLDHDLKNYMIQMRGLINQVESMRRMIEEIHSRTIKTESYTNLKEE